MPRSNTKRNLTKEDRSTPLKEKKSSIQPRSRLSSSTFEDAQANISGPLKNNFQVMRLALLPELQSYSNQVTEFKRKIDTLSEEKETLSEYRLHLLQKVTTCNRTATLLTGLGIEGCEELPQPESVHSIMDTKTFSPTLSTNEVVKELTFSLAEGLKGVNAFTPVNCTATFLESESQTMKRQSGSDFTRIQVRVQGLDLMNIKCYLEISGQYRHTIPENYIVFGNTIRFKQLTYRHGWSAATNKAYESSRLYYGRNSSVSEHHEKHRANNELVPTNLFKTQ